MQLTIFQTLCKKKSPQIEILNQIFFACFINVLTTLTGTVLYVNVGIRINLWIEWQHEFALYTIKKIFWSDFPQSLLVCLSWGCKLKGLVVKELMVFQKKTIWDLAGNSNQKIILNSVYCAKKNVQYSSYIDSVLKQIRCTNSVQYYCLGNNKSTQATPEKTTLRKCRLYIGTLRLARQDVSNWVSTHYMKTSKQLDVGCLGCPGFLAHWHTLMAWVLIHWTVEWGEKFIRDTIQNGLI